MFGKLLFCFQCGRLKQIGGGPNQKINNWLWWLLIPPVFQILNLVMSKLYKRSTNDEKWWDYFSLVITLNISASGKVGAKHKMAEYIQRSKITFGKIWIWSNLEGKSQNEQLKVNPCGLSQADNNIQKDRWDDDGT